MAEFYNIPEFNYLEYLTPDGFNPGIADSVSNYLDRLDEIFRQISNSASDRKDRFYNLGK